MNYENRFKRFVEDLLTLIEEHVEDCDEAEHEIYDADDAMERMEAEKDKPCEPVIYPKKKKRDTLKVIR